MLSSISMPPLNVSRGELVHGFVRNGGHLHPKWIIALLLEERIQNINLLPNDKY
jgi:hypothetical protein